MPALFVRNGARLVEQVETLPPRWGWTVFSAPSVLPLFDDCSHQIFPRCSLNLPNICSPRSHITRNHLSPTRKHLPHSIFGLNVWILMGTRRWWSSKHNRSERRIRAMQEITICSSYCEKVPIHMTERTSKSSQADYGGTFLDTSGQNVIPAGKWKTCRIYWPSSRPINQNVIIQQLV